MGTATQDSDLKTYVNNAQVLVHQYPTPNHFRTESLNGLIEGKVKVHKLFHREHE